MAHGVIASVIASLIFAILFSIYSHFVGWWPFNRDTSQKALTADQTPSNTTNTPVQDKVFLREKTATEIFDYLKTLHPLDREETIKNSYIGRFVNWQGKVLSIRPSRNESIGSEFVVGISEIDTEFLKTVLFLSAEWKDKLKVLRLGDIIVFEGKIYGIDINIILTESSFSLLESKK